MPITSDGANLLEQVGACDAERRLLTAIRCVASCRGLFLALLLVEAALESYLRLTNLSRVAFWLAVVQALFKRLEELEDEGAVGLRTAPLADQANVYSRLCASYVVRLKPDCHDRALALLGVLVADACSHNRTLTEPAVAGWYTLIQGGGRSQDWRDFSSLVPAALPELNDALVGSKAPGLLDLLSAVIAALGRPLVEPEQEPPEPGQPEGGHPRKGEVAPGSSQPHEPPQANDDLADGEDDPKSAPGGGRKRGPLDNEKRRANPIGWLVIASNYAPHLQRFDLVGHLDRLHPAVTQAHWRSLKESFLTKGEQEKARVAFAHVSQRLAQPARIGLALRLDGQRSTRLDAPTGAVVWNCRAALSDEADPALDALELRDRSYAIVRPLDADIADYLRLCLAARPWATTLAELLGIDTSPDALKEWLRRYREFLRDQGDAVQIAYDARFANSLGDVYRHRGAGEAMALFGGLDFDALPFGMAHYITFDAAFTTAVEQDLFQFLGWRMPEGWRATGPEGSPLSITTQEFRDGWALCQQRTSQARQDLKAARTAQEFEAAFNQLSRLRLLAAVTLAGHRGTLLSRLTWRALYQHRGVIHIFDKDVGEYQSNRCIPVHKRLNEVLAAWQGDLDLMHAKAAELGLTLAREGRRALPTRAPDDPVFFVVRVATEESTTLIERAALRVGSVAAEAGTCFGRPLNIGRHFLITQLITRRISAWHVRVLSGHCRIHAEAFADGMHVPPAHAFAVLKDSIEQLLAELELAPVACIEAPGSARRLIPHSGTLPGAVDPYLAPSAGNVFRILPPPFDTFTTLALSAVEDLRTILCGVTDLSAEAEFTAAQTLFGLWDRADQETVFSNLNAHLFELNQVAGASWMRARSAQPIAVPLNDRVVIALARIKDRTKPGAWKTSAEEVGRWARTSLPALPWPTADLDAFLCLLSLALRYRRFHFSPDSLTAASTALPSATFSLRSILRAAGRDPDPLQAGSSLGKALREGTPRQINDKDKDEAGPLKDVAAALRDVSRIVYPLGGEIQRSNDWQVALERIDLKDDLRATCLRRIHEAEIDLWQKQNRKEADETSTLAGHLPEILTALRLLSPREDVSEFTEQEWREWIQASRQAVDEKGKNTKAVKEKRTRHFGLRRLVRIARKLGWAPPRGLFDAGGPRLTFDGLRKSAASVALLEADHTSIQRLLADHFDDWPLLQWKAELAALLHQHHPLRSSEQAALVVACLVRASRMLLIAPGEFSHLKSVHAYRLIECARQVIELLDRIEDDGLELNSKYLFLDESGWDWSDARQIDEAQVSAAAQVTGEAAVRKHSFRGSAFLRLLWPCWELVARSVLGVDCSPRALRQMLAAEWGRGFGAAALAARSAGHGLQLMGLVYYAAAWPLMLAAQSRALLDGMEPSPALIAGVLGSTGSIRNEKSAAKATAKEFDVWSAVARRCVKRMNLPPLSPSDQRAVIAPRSNGSDFAEPPLMARFRLVAGMLAGGDRDSLADKLGIPKPQALALEAALPCKDRLKAITRRRRGLATADQLAEDRDYLFSDEGTALLSRLAAHPVPALVSLLTDLAPYRRNPREPRPSALDLMARLKSHLLVLPAPLRLQIRFSTRHGRLLNAEQLHPLGPRLEVGTDDPRAGGQPQCQVMPSPRPPPPDGGVADKSASQHDQSELVGRLTVVTRVFIEAIEITHQAKKGTLS